MRKTRSSSSSGKGGAAAAGAGDVKKKPEQPALPPPPPPSTRKRPATPPPPASSLPSTPAPRKLKKQQSASSKSPPSTPTDPFPTWPRPTPRECWAVRDALAELHGELPTFGPAAAAQSQSRGGDGCSAVAGGSVLGALVRTILSQNTTDATSARAYASLRAEFAESGGGSNDQDDDAPVDGKERALWERVRTTPPGRLENAIRVGGLADIKAARIRAILDTLVAEEEQEEKEQQAAAGAAAAAKPKIKGPSLERLRLLSDEDAKAQLLRFNGVGPKSAACVLMFALNRAEFAVDTHVLHICARPPLRWVPAPATREQAYQHLNARVPNDCKVALHVLLVEHGKRCPSCAKGGRLATTKSEGGGWLATEKGRAAAKALASGEARCPLARAVAAAAGAAAGAAEAGVVKKEEEQAAAGMVVKKEEEEEAAMVVKKEEEEEG